MALSNDEAARIALGYLNGVIASIDDDYGDIAEAVSEAHEDTADRDYELVAEYLTDWRIRLQRLIREIGAV